jgi:hypothetical protein
MIRDAWLFYAEHEKGMRKNLRINDKVGVLV